MSPLHSILLNALPFCGCGRVTYAIIALMSTSLKVTRGPKMNFEIDDVGVDRQEEGFLSPKLDLEAETLISFL